METALARGEQGNPPLAQFAKAFAAAQAQLANPKFDKVNTAFGKPSGYASLPSILDSVRPVLTKHGISVLQMPTNAADGKFSLTTMLVHVSGESVQATFSMALPSDPQKAVAMSTYLRRMSLSSMLGVAGDEDDDGNVASSPSVAQDAPARRQPAATRPKPSDASEGVVGAVERALAGKSAAKVRITGTVERIWENEKTTKVVLEGGETLKCFNDLPGIEHLAVGKHYEFSCKPSNNPKYPDPVVSDFREVASEAGEEIPF